MPVDSPGAALAAVRKGEADFACVAIENSVDGPVTPTFDALTMGPELQIYRETEIGVEFSILVRPGTDPASVRSFTTHPVAYPQVKQWVDANLPGVDFHSATSNAAAAHLVADGVHDACAAPARAGELLGLEAIARAWPTSAAPEPDSCWSAAPACPPPAPESTEPACPSPCATSPAR